MVGASSCCARPARGRHGPLRSAHVFVAEFVTKHWFKGGCIELLRSACWRASRATALGLLLFDTQCSSQCMGSREFNEAGRKGLKQTVEAGRRSRPAGGTKQAGRRHEAGRHIGTKQAGRWHEAGRHISTKQAGTLARSRPVLARSRPAGGTSGFGTCRIQVSDPSSGCAEL